MKIPEVTLVSSYGHRFLVTFKWLHQLNDPGLVCCGKLYYWCKSGYNAWYSSACCLKFCLFFLFVENGNWKPYTKDRRHYTVIWRQIGDIWRHIFVAMQCLCVQPSAHVNRQWMSSRDEFNPAVSHLGSHVKGVLMSPLHRMQAWSNA